MNYRLGVDVGTTFTAAAIWRQDEGTTEAVALGSRTPSVPSVLFVGADGSVLVGEVAERRALTDPDRVVREFTRRIGDDTPLVVGGQPYAAHDLAAMMIRWVVDRVTEREGGSPDQIAITHPASWGPFKKDLLSQALGAFGLEDVTFLAEPAAAAVSYASQQRVEAGATIAVYDLGGGTFDAAVVRKTGADSFALLGSAAGLQRLGGADFDEAVVSHVRDRLSAQPDVNPWDTLDVEDPSVLSGLTRLRRECTEAKEALSSDTEVTIPVLLPGASTQVRLVRGEFEDMIRPALEDTVDLLCRAIRSAGVSTDELDAVLLVGGSSRMPLVTQLVSAQLGCPVRVDADPQTTIALGAALSMVPQAKPAPITAVTIAAPAVDPDVESFKSRQPRPSHAPGRPPMIPAPREGIEDRESTEDDASRRRPIMAGRVRTVVGAGVLSGVLLIALAVAAPGGLPAFTDGPGDTPPATAESPGGAVVAADPGGHAEPAAPAPPHVEGNGKAATKVAKTASVPRAATSASRPAHATPAPQVEQVTDPVPSAPPVSTSGNTPDDGANEGGTTGGGTTGDGTTGSGTTGDGTTDGGTTDDNANEGGTTGGGATDGGTTTDPTTPSDPPPSQSTL